MRYEPLVLVALPIVRHLLDDRVQVNPHFVSSSSISERLAFTCIGSLPPAAVFCGQGLLS
jgi:hypothetical protein